MAGIGALLSPPVCIDLQAFGVSCDDVATGFGNARRCEFEDCDLVGEPEDSQHNLINHHRLLGPGFDAPKVIANESAFIEDTEWALVLLMLAGHCFEDNSARLERWSNA